MSALNVSVPHQLTQQEALDKIKNLLKTLKEEQKSLIGSVNEEWNGNNGKFAFSAQGFDLSGTIAVTPTTVDIDADLPFALSFFKGKIAEIIQGKAGELLKK